MNIDNWLSPNRPLKLEQNKTKTKIFLKLSAFSHQVVFLSVDIELNLFLSNFGIERLLSVIRI